MRLPRTAIILATAAALAAPAPCAAQKPVTSFDQLNTRLKPGDTVWITDVQGREVTGKIASVTSETVALEGSGAPVFPASDVRVVRRRDPDRGSSTGATIGAVAGLGVGIAACAALPKDDPMRTEGCTWAIALTPLLGSAVGLGVGFIFPGKKQTVYSAPAPAGGTAARLSIAPVITPRAKGAALSFAF
jgi:hypothetical protein